MSEIFPDQEPNAAASLALAVESNDPVAIARANTAYIDAVFPDAQHTNNRTNIYSEVHRIGDNVIIVPSVNRFEEHWATVGGNHSFYDAQVPPIYGSTASYMESVLGARIGLSTETVVGKGELSPVADGPGYELKLSNIWLGKGHDYAWLQALAANASNYDDLNVEYTDGSKVHQPLETGLPLKTHASVEYKTVRLPNEQPGVISGIVTGVDSIEVPRVVATGRDPLYRQGSIVLNAFEGRVGVHAPVIKEAGIENNGIFTIQMGELTQRLLARYVIDRKNDRSNIYINYFNPQTESPDFQDLRVMVRDALTNHISGEDIDPAQQQLHEEFTPRANL